MYSLKTHLILMGIGFGFIFLGVFLGYPISLIGLGLVIHTAWDVYISNDIANRERDILIRLGEEDFIAKHNRNYNFPSKPKIKPAPQSSTTRRREARSGYVTMDDWRGVSDLLDTTNHDLNETLERAKKKFKQEEDDIAERIRQINKKVDSMTRGNGRNNYR